MPVSYGDGRAFTSGYFGLQLDGVACGIIQKFEGGSVSAEVVSEPVSGSYLPKKHLGPIKYNDFTMTMGLSMAKPVSTWIEDSFKMKYARKNGALQVADYKLDVRAERQFFNALITEVTFPACDATSKEPAYMSVKFAPEYTRNTNGSGKVQGPVSANQKLYRPENFRLEIDGLKCQKVNKVDALVVKQTVLREEIGDARDYAVEPGKLEHPSLKVTLSEVDAESFYKWHEDFLIKGNCEERHEKTGTLVYLSPNRKDELLELKFKHLGIFKLDADGSENNSDKIRRVTVEMYCEEIEAHFKVSA